VAFDPILVVVMYVLLGFQQLHYSTVEGGVHGSFVKVRKCWMKGVRLSEMAADDHDGRECLMAVMAVGYGKAYRGDALEQARSL
jgi:hypothetical protein